MKNFVPTIILTFALHSLALAKDKAIDKPVAEAMKSHLLEFGYLNEDRKFTNIGKVFKGATIYQVWVKSSMEEGTASGIALSVLVRGDEIAVFSSGREAAIALLKGYEKKIANVKELRVLMEAMTPVSEIEDKGDGVFHVYNGDDFFDVPSGYLVKIGEGKVLSCEYKMKLGEKK